MIMQLKTHTQQKNYKTLASFLSIALFPTIMAFVYQAPTQAGTSSVLQIGDTKTELFARRAPVPGLDPGVVGQYHVKGGVSGVLYFIGKVPEVRDNPDFWAYRYRFFDVSGKERCRGTLEQGWYRMDEIKANEYWFQS